MTQNIAETEVVDDADKKVKNNIKKQDNKKFFSWIWLIISVIYIISPIDVIPDIIPVGGRLDDVLIIFITTINFVQQHFFQYDKKLNTILGLLKQVLILLLILVSIVFILLIAFFIKIKI